MKYKVIGVVLCVCLVITSIFVKFDNDPDMKRYHQHRDATPKAACTSHSDDVFCTHLPLVEIDTKGQVIPGTPIRDSEDKRIGYVTAPDGSDRIVANIKIIDNEGVYNHLDDKPNLESNAEIHIRGNSSRRFDKSSYAINLVDENGENNWQEVLGMDAHHEWVMHGPFLDKTLIRNYMWYNIAGEMMEYAPNVRFCEAFIDGEYQGVYLITETITAGKNGSRLDLEVDRKDNTYSGYLLRMDREAKSEEQAIDSFTRYTYLNSHGIEVRYPGPGNITPELQRSITKDFSDFEKAIYSYDFDDEEYGYRSLIDVDSFVDYFIINEITCNIDAGKYSTYIYKDIDGKYKMCVWDFNNCCDNYQQESTYTEDYNVQNCIWFEFITKDDYINKRIIKRYKELRKGILSDEYLESYINDTIEYLGPAIDRNFDKWGYTFDSNELLKPVDRNIHSYYDAVNELRSALENRAHSMDENIESILQYSADSKIKKYIENAN